MDSEAPTSYFQELLDSLLEHIVRDFDESFNGRSDTAILRTVCKKFRKVIDTSIPYFCLYRTLTDAIHQHNEKPYSSPWFTKFQEDRHSVLFDAKPTLRELRDDKDLPEDPKDEPLLALEILLSTVRAEKYLQYHCSGLYPYIEILYMPFVEETNTILSRSSFVLTIPKSSKRFGGKRVVFQFKELSLYLHIEDKQLLEYLALPATDVMIRPQPSDFDYVNSFNFCSKFESKIIELLDDELQREFYRADNQKTKILHEQVTSCQDYSKSLLKYSKKSLITILPTLPRSLFLLMIDQDGDFWNNLYSSYDLIDRFRTNAIHGKAMKTLLLTKYRSSDAKEFVEILCRAVEYESTGEFYFYAPKATKILMLSAHNQNMTYYYRKDELDGPASRELIDPVDQDKALLLLQKDLSFPSLLTPEQFRFILNDFNDVTFQRNETAVNLPQPPPLREGAKNSLKNTFKEVDISAQLISATIFFEDFADPSANNSNQNTGNHIYYSSCRTAPSERQDRDHYSLMQILQVESAENKEYYFHLRFGHLNYMLFDNEHFVYTIKVPLEQAKAYFDFWTRYFARKGMRFNVDEETLKLVMHIERLPHYPEMIRKGEVDPSLAAELVQLFPSATTYLCHAEVVERQQGIDSAIKVIDEAMEYGGKIRAHRLVELWNKKIELFIKAKKPVNAFLCYILSCQNALIRKFPAGLYEQMMAQLERDQEYELEISPDQLILCQIFKLSNVFSSTNRQALQVFGQLSRDARINCKSCHPDIFPIKEIFDVLSKLLRIEFVPSQSEERQFVISKFGIATAIGSSHEFAVFKVENKSIPLRGPTELHWTAIRHPLSLLMLLLEGTTPPSVLLNTFLTKSITSSPISVLCEIEPQSISKQDGNAFAATNPKFMAAKYIVLNNVEKREDDNADVLVRFLNLLDSRSKYVNGQFIAACCDYFSEYASVRWLAKRHAK